MKSLWIFLLMFFIAESCTEDKDIRNPSITRIRYEIKNSYKETLFFDLEYLMLSDVRFKDSFEIIPGRNKVLFSLAYISGTLPEFTCSDRLVSLTATNLKGDALLRNDPLIPEWWDHSMVPVGIDTFHICFCILDSTDIASSGMVLLRH